MNLAVVVLPDHNPARNLATELAVLELVATSPEVSYLLFYENLPSVIVGKSLDPAAEVWLHKKLTPVFRRQSGGGTVVHGSGNLNYSYITPLRPELLDVHGSFRRILGAIITGFQGKLSLYQQGISDLCIHQAGRMRKISGNAQLRRKRVLLQHGTFLYSTHSLHLINASLQMPGKVPEYRSGRNHRDFMVRALPWLTSATVRGCITRGIAEGLVHKFAPPAKPFLTEQPWHLRLNYERKFAPVDILRRA